MIRLLGIDVASSTWESNGSAILGLPIVLASLLCTVLLVGLSMMMGVWAQIGQ